VPRRALPPARSGANAGQAESGNGLAEVVVTAQRRSENLQDVPIFRDRPVGRDLEAQQVDSALDLGRLVPNFFSSNNVGQASANVYYIRGLGQTQSFPTFEPEVGTYVDDIYITRQNANNFAMFGVDQVQVLTDRRARCLAEIPPAAPSWSPCRSRGTSSEATRRSVTVLR